jgi:DNA-directed RNA polymerase
LIDIHKNLLTNEHLVHLLSDEDIATLHQGYEKFKQFSLIQKAAKSVGKGASKKLGNLDNLKL